MLPVISSEAQRMLEVSVAGNLTILENSARRQSGRHIELLPASVTTASIIALALLLWYFMLYKETFFLLSWFWLG